VSSSSRRPATLQLPVTYLHMSTPGLVFSNPHSALCWL
jgi:hypothetical protein